MRSESETGSEGTPGVGDTCEATEQGEATLGGSRGGKGLPQGEQPLGGRGSDTEPKCRVDPNDGCASGESVTKSFIARRPTRGGARCVSSARRDLCGGRGEILVPTATVGVTGIGRIVCAAPWPT